MATFRGLQLLIFTLLALAASALTHAHPLKENGTTISRELFFELEELARIVDIAYCVGTAGLGIQKPFECASHCGDEDFKHFELVTAWNTGPLLSDSCGYIAVSHPPSAPRIILAFRGTYSIANTIVDLSTIPQEYVPYPGDDSDDDDSHGSLSDLLNPMLGPLSKRSENDGVDDGDGEDPPPANPPKCTNCTVHTGFYTSWLNTRKAILPELTEAIEKYPDYKLVLVGHSLGGAVAAIAGLDLQARGWDPYVTTFGEPRIGNKALASYVNARFNISNSSTSEDTAKFHRVTHANDPVPLLPLSEWGYTMHSEELFISADSLPFVQEDIKHCDGDEDPTCIADTDPSKPPSWGIPTRFKFWELFFAHRDYFWRIGLCVPGGDPRDWYRKYPKHGGEDGDDNVQSFIDEL